MNISPLPFSKRDYIIRGLSVLLYGMVLPLIFSAISFFSSSFVLFFILYLFGILSGFLGAIYLFDQVINNLFSSRRRIQ